MHLNDNPPCLLLCVRAGHMRCGLPVLHTPPSRSWSQPQRPNSPRRNGPSVTQQQQQQQRRQQIVKISPAPGCVEWPQWLPESSKQPTICRTATSPSHCPSHRRCSYFKQFGEVYALKPRPPSARDQPHPNASNTRPAPVSRPSHQSVNNRPPSPPPPQLVSVYSHLSVSSRHMAPLPQVSVAASPQDTPAPATPSS
jgi:hypothetical protein